MAKRKGRATRECGGVARVMGGSKKTEQTVRTSSRSFARLQNGRMRGATALAVTLTVLFTLYVRNDAATSTRYTAMGNLQTVINGETLFSTDLDPERPPTGELWCQVREGAIHHNTTWARFVRARDNKAFIADIQGDNKAYLYFSKSKAEASGKYRCEIKVPDNSVITGNMFAYSHPIVKNNESWPLKKSDQEESLAVGPTVYASLDSTARIGCPIIGYPEPNIVWYKDKFPLELGERVTYDRASGVLSIEGAKEADAGVYRCEATNSFPVKLDTQEQEFIVKLDQELRIGDYYGWMLPLAIILITLLLLFLIIFTCQRCTKYNSAQYNVADRERALHNDQVPLKNSV
ncbi:unnamed protein product [Caenorhabditis sp. 36 PRJEB53466]|nr:unnamed protein product [Caenorhabditis sp. 36 PRJEB53466]